MLDRIGYGLAARAAGGASIDPQALTFDYPSGRVDLFVARLDAAPRDLSPARAALARRLIAHRTGTNADKLFIGHTEDGAPRLAEPRLPLCLSLAGRDDVIAAAVADRPVGVDIEILGPPVSPPLNVLNASERAALAVAGEDTHEYFLHLWTAKEAYVKAIETGLSREPAEIEIRFDGVGRSWTSAQECASALVVIDRGREVAMAFARAGRISVGGRPAILACAVLLEPAFP